MSPMPFYPLMILLVASTLGFGLVGGFLWLVGWRFDSDVVSAGGWGMVVGVGGFSVLFLGSTLSLFLIPLPGPLAGLLTGIWLFSLFAGPGIPLVVGLAFAVRASDRKPVRWLRGRLSTVENGLTIR